MRAFFLGLLLALGQPPFPLGALVPLVLARAFTLRGFSPGFLFGLGFWGLTLAWLPASFFARFGPFGALPFLVLIPLLAAFFGVLFALLGGRPLALVGGWVLFEVLMQQGELAFPWGDLGYAFALAPGRPVAGWLGLLGLSLLALLVGYGLFHRRYWVLLPWLFLWFWPFWPKPPADQQALVVQAAVDPLAKAAGLEAGGRYLALTRAGLKAHPEAAFVVWPETAVWRLPSGIDAVLGDRPLIYGTWGPAGENRVALYQKGRVVAWRDKARLVPFGEFFPFRQVLGPVYAFFFRRMGLPPLRDLPRRGVGAPLGPFAAYICYESDFPELVRGLVGRGGRVLVNLSNDAWFGVGYGRAQHLWMAGMRAAELGLWLVRAANDGISAGFDPFGRITGRLGPGEKGFLAVPFSEESPSLYARVGPLPALGLALVLLVLGLFEKRPPVLLDRGKLEPSPSHRRR